MTTASPATIAALNENSRIDVTRFAHWMPRAALASVFIFHGVGKLINVAGFAEMMGLPLAVAWLVTLAEVGGGIGILAGSFGRDWLTR